MSDRPLHIYEVLEEEYERLQGRPSPSLNTHERSEERLKNIIRENHKQQLSAICLSGGGIRSATFGLGVLQGLAHNKLLHKFSYLSTVSGGGYVGGWLSAWIHRHDQGIAGVEGELPSEHPSFVMKPEPEPVTHLRSYSNYLTPRLGLLSADTWTLIAIVLRNLILIWLVLVPLLIAVLALPRLFVSLSQLSPPAWGRLAAFAIGFISGMIMIIYVAISRPTITKKHRDRKSFLKWCLTPMLVSATLLALYWSWFTNAPNTQLERNLTFHVLDGHHQAFGFIAFGVLLHLLAFAVYTWMIARPIKLILLEFVGLGFNGLIGGTLLWFVTSQFFPNPSFEWWKKGLDIRELILYSSFAVPIYLVLNFLALTLFVGLASRWTEDEDREWWARYGGWILLVIVIWAVGSFLVLVGPPLSSYLWGEYVIPAGGLTGLITALVARSSKLPSKDQQSGGITAILMRYALPLGAIVFAVVLIVSVSLGTNYLVEWLADVWRSVLPALRISTTWLHMQRFVLNGGSVTAGPLATKLLFPSTREILILIGLAAGLGVLMARFINTNKFSHHAMYRNRLIRAYLGASRQSVERHPDPFTGFDPDDNLSLAELRPGMLHSRSFADFELFVNKLREKQESTSNYIHSKLLSRETRRLLRQYDPDNPGDHSRKLLQTSLIKDLNNCLLRGIPLVPDRHHREIRDDGDASQASILANRRAFDAAFPEEIQPVKDPNRPLLHVINMTLNLVHGDRLAWQQRKAESFTATPLHCGSFQIPDSDDRTVPVYGAYRRTHDYAGNGGISIGTAMAISGAAVSPNMGYYSSPVVTLLMTVFNVRLGWWLGNPGSAGQGYYPLAYPKSAVYPIIAEALGLTDDKNNYVYLSDGGHFENLGLYEMVLRRCRLIVISDASDDAEFEFDNLGNAVQKIRTDFGIPIDFQPMQIFPRKDKKKGAYCAIGTIRYSCVDKVRDDQGKEVSAPDGTIVYIKPVFYGDEPRDIYHYAMTHGTFPHESTANQWFSEAQFESYRKLGSHIVDMICKFQSGNGKETSFADSDVGAFVSKAAESAQAKAGSNPPTTQN
jgi:hypothetical protein